jgi:hypothetical protein
MEQRDEVPGDSGPDDSGPDALRRGRYPLRWGGEGTFAIASRVLLKTVHFVGQYTNKALRRSEPT